MCGIAGFIDYGLKTDESKFLIDNMLKSIKHRGPDNSSSWQFKHTTLGHNRLSIIDLSEAANQPFLFQDIAIVFNGEIYNYIEIKSELRSKGWEFTTSSDTEVICVAYKQWGIDCVNRFMGMWAFAIYDTTKDTLFCSRDRFGIKPFYYTTTKQGFYFASEYKAFKSITSIKRTINYDHLTRGIALNFTTYKHETHFNELHSLEPAHSLVITPSETIKIKYWQLNTNNHISELSFKDKCNKFYELYINSVSLHSRSDVNNGICLSGGLDSSAIASAYSTLFPNSPIKSFTIYYEGKNKVDERPFVKTVIDDYYNIQPFYFSPTDQEITEHFHNSAYFADVPLLGSSYISQYFLMKLASENGVKVVLDGQGSDEYLGGYLHTFYRLLGEKYKQGKISSAFNLLNKLKERESWNNKQAFNFALKSLAPAFYDESNLYQLETKKIKKLTSKVEFSLDNTTSDKLNNFLYHLLFSTTLQTLLHHEDRNSMAFSIESRVPFLDHRLVEFAFSLQTEDRISRNAETKYILREGLKSILPQSVYARKDKKGFVTPGEVDWLRGPLKFLLEGDFTRMDFLNIAEVKKEIQTFKNGSNKNANIVWRLAATNYWLKHFSS